MREAGTADDVNLRVPMLLHDLPKYACSVKILLTVLFHLRRHARPTACTLGTALPFQFASEYTRGSVAMSRIVVHEDSIGISAHMVKKVCTYSVEECPPAEESLEKLMATPGPPLMY